MTLMQKLQSWLDSLNASNHDSDTTVTDAVLATAAAKAAIASAITAKGGTVGASDGLADFPAAIAGIPSGGSDIITHEYTHAEDWPDASLGNAQNLWDTYFADDYDGGYYLAYAEVKNNENAGQYRLDYFESFAFLSGQGKRLQMVRRGSTTNVFTKFSESLCYLCAGAKVKTWMVNLGVGGDENAS